MELYKLSGFTVDISGWQLWGAGNDDWFTFPGVYAFVITSLQTGGSLPIMTNPASLVFDAGRSGGVLNNGVDNVVLYDPGTDVFIQMLYNGDAADNPPVDYTGFSPTATLVGFVENFGNDQDGVSLTRFPSGDDNIILHTATLEGGQASPNAVLVQSLTARNAIKVYLLIPFVICKVLLRAIIFTKLKQKEYSGFLFQILLPAIPIRTAGLF